MGASTRLPAGGFRAVWALMLAGTAHAAVEAGIALATGHRYFLSGTEMARYAALAWAGHGTLVTLLGLILVGAWRLIVRPEDVVATYARLRIAVVAAATPVLGTLLWALTAGRRVRDVPGRAVWVALLALALGFGLASALAWTLRRFAHAESGRKRLFSAVAALCMTLLGVNALVLPRLYPAFHLALGATSLIASALLALAAAHGRTLSQRALWPGYLGFAAAVSLAPWTASSLAQAPNGRFAVSQTAPISARWMSIWAQANEAATPKLLVAPTSRAQGREGSGVDLRGGDILLITIDALRADRLAAYGGHGLTPHMDALAKQGVVFARAYTPTPHTSYALASLLTAKFMRPVLDLPNPSQDHRTLAEVLRRYGYRTAAFYPPAVFFVDSERFESLRRDDFSFEYRKVMYASAQARVKQVQQYLAQAEPGHPVFVWVHLFEPHEPYAPAARFARGDSPVERYDAEVTQADDGVGGIVAAFRAKRPKATVIVTADHGEEFGDHGGSFHGSTLFDEQVRVPLVWASPGLSAGVVEAPVETVDVGTTLLASLGIPRDARMRGDDLSMALADPQAGRAPQHAFVDIGNARMVSDGRLKLICGNEDDACLLFDLVDDPRETRDLATERPQDVARLRAELSRFVGSIPRVEAMALAQGVGWPDALARGRLGDRTVGADLVPLLGSERAQWRAGAARLCGELRYAASRKELDLLRATDADPAVRGEAAIASLKLGHDEARAQVRALMTSQLDRELLLRGALQLASVGDATGRAVLDAVAGDESASEAQRVAAIGALGELRAAESTQTIIDRLGDVRLRPAAATALGRIGGKQAKVALLSALEQERYPIAREAEARALIALKERKVRVLIERFLGTETSLPGGVLMLAEIGALTPPSPRGARLLEARSWQIGPWACDARGCWPARPAGVADDALVTAQLRLPSKTKPHARFVLALEVTAPTAVVVVDGVRHELTRGERQISWLAEATATPVIELAASEGGHLLAVAIVAPTEEIPPPAPVKTTPAAND